jgi:hypothetical protein
VRQRIRETFFSDLFLMLANSSNPAMTATEVAERHEEKLTMLGPVLERLHNELLQPLIDITFDRMLEVGALLPPPPDLLGMDISVEFVSVLAQAQRMIGSNGIDRFMGNVVALSKVKPDVLDKVNFDEWADSYSRMLGVDASMLVDDADVQALRDARAKAQAAQEQANMQNQQAQTAKNLAQSPTGGAPNALTDVMAGLTGYSSQATPVGGTP